MSLYFEHTCSDASVITYKAKKAKWVLDIGKKKYIVCVCVYVCVFEHETVNNGGNMRKIVGFVFNKEEKDIVEYILQSYFLLASCIW